MKRSRLPEIDLVKVVMLTACAMLLSGCDWFVSTEQRMTRAEQKMAAADDRGALIELQSAVRSEPGNARAHLRLTEISLRLDDPKSAEKEVQLAIKSGAPAEQTQPLLAEVRLALSEFDPLLQLIESGELKLPEPARSTYLGLALLGKNEPQKAVAALEQALAVDPKWVRARIALAEAQTSQGQSELALKEINNVLDANPKDATAALLRGTILARRGDYAAAVTALKSARENRAGQLSARQQALTMAVLTQAQLALGDLQGAQAAHDELEQKAPTAQMTRLLAARLAMVKQDYTTAVAEAQKLLSSTPDLAAAKMLLGAALLAQGNINQAEVQLAEVVEQSPENMEARKLLARANLQLQRPDMAIQVLSAAQQSETIDPQLDLLLGWANLQRGDDATATALLERSVAAQPDNPNLKLDLAVAYVSAGQHDKAVELLRQVPAKVGGARRVSLLVTALAVTQGIDAARAEIDRAVAATPDEPAVLKVASSFYARQGDLAKARSLLARAAAKEPSSIPTLLSQARLEIAAGDMKTAALVVDKALVVNPKDMSARMLQVELTARSGDLAAAGKQLEEIRAKDPAAVEPRLLLARLYLRQKKTQEVDDVIRELRSRAQNDAPVAHAIGNFYLDAGRFDEALGWFRMATQKNAANPTYALSVARTQLALGNDSAASETLHAIVAANPTSIPASAALVMLDLQAGRTEAVATRMAELLKLHPQDAAVAMLQGDVAMTSKSYKDAAQAYARAMELAPSSAVAVRAYRANQLGGLPQATAPLESWLQRQPADVAARMVLAEGYAAAGQRDRAIEQYERMVAAERPNAMALNNLAWLYHEKRDQRAAATAKRAYTAAPQVAAIADTYGWILVRDGDVKAGLPLLEKAVADSKSQPDIRYHYAAALAQAGQRDKARRELQELTRGEAKFASSAEAQKLLAELGG